MTTLTWTTDLETTSCWCGIPLAVPSSLMKEARNNGTAIYCPIGHTFVFGKTTVDKLRAELDQEKARVVEYRSWLSQEEERRHAEERRHSATKGVLTKTRKRVAKGVCPCCNRHFANVERHMTSQHPDFAGEVADHAD